MSKHRRVGCQKCWEWGEECEHLKQKIYLSTWTIQKHVGVWLDYQLIRDRDIILIGWWIMPCRRGGLAWFRLLKQSWLQRPVPCSRLQVFLAAPPRVGALRASSGGVWKTLCESWGCFGSLVCVHGSEIHHSGFYGSCFCGRQTVASLIPCSRNHNKHPENLESIHTRFFLPILLFLSLEVMCMGCF